MNMHLGIRGKHEHAKQHREAGNQPQKFPSCEPHENSVVKNAGRRFRFRWLTITVAWAVLGLGTLFVRADYNPERSGFCKTYPTSYQGWQSSFLAGNGKIGIMVFGNPLNETVIYNDRGFNLAGNGGRSFARISNADLETIKDDCVKGRNRVTVKSLSWDMSAHTVNATVKSDIDQEITLIERSGIKTLKSSAAVGTSPVGEIARVVRLKAGVSTPLSIELATPQH
jgi:hypothetical protein